MWTTRGNYILREESSIYMGGILHYRDFNQGKVSQKFSINKRHADGLVAPRNSLELSTEISKSYQTVHENIPFSLQVQQQHSKRQFHHPGGITMKKLIDKEMSSNTTRHSAPNVIARLMGMDTLPSENRVLVHSNDYRNENSSKYLPRKKNLDETSTQYKQLGVMSSRHKNQKSSVYDLKQHTNGCTNSPRLTKPHRHDHPQEELLQKFKKEFEAWQAAKLWERSRAVGLDDGHLKERNNQIPGRENFEKQKKVMYAETERNSFCRTSAESLTSSTAILGTRSQRSGLRHDECMSKEGLPSFVEAGNSRNRKKINDLGQYPGLKFNEKGDRSSSPMRIVILKPSTERTDDIEESWPCSSGILEGEGSMEYFLEEVRERLRFEIQGKARNEIKTGKYCGEIPFSEKLTDPKQIAQHIAKQIRESVTRDLGTTLMRSESTRSYRSEAQLNGPDSPEFMNRTTRKRLSDRLRNVLRNEVDIGVNTVANGRLGPSSIAKESARSRQSTDSSNLGKSSYSEDMKDGTEITMSFREEHMNNVGSSSGDLSPRNLMRSLSAPVPGTAFGKLLLEDQNVRSGVHIQRKHESTESSSVEVGKMKKDVFNFKGRVSNLRHNLTLRGKLFGRKVQSADESGEKTFDSIKAIATSPAVVFNLGISQENSTEVPPSPASVSGSSFDDLCKPSNPSPVSPLELPFTEEHLSLQNSEITSNLPEVQCQSEPIGIAALDELPNGEELYDATDMGCPEEAYLRNILMTAGLYDKSFDKIYACFDVQTELIAESVFEKVEKAQVKTENMNDEACLSGTVAGRRILFDLLNEELHRMLSLPIASSFLRRSLGSTQAPPCKKLLGDMWRQLETQLHPPVDDSGSLDSLVACDLSVTTWSVLLQEDFDVVGGDVEYMILSELIDQFVEDLCC